MRGAPAKFCLALEAEWCHGIGVAEKYAWEQPGYVNPVTGKPAVRGEAIEALETAPMLVGEMAVADAPRKAGRKPRDIDAERALSLRASGWGCGLPRGSWGFRRPCWPGFTSGSAGDTGVSALDGFERLC